MTQECERIISAAERLQNERNYASRSNPPTSRVSYNSGELEPSDMLREYQENLGQFEADLKQVLEDHKKNDEAW